MDKITPGQFVLYATDRLSTPKKCRVGKVLSVARTEDCVIVHRMDPQKMHSLRIKWHLIYLDKEGKETTEATAKPSTARLESKDILQVTTISRDGVLGHKTARTFDKWDLEPSAQEREPEEALTYVQNPAVAEAAADIRTRFETFLQEATSPCRGTTMTSEVPKGGITWSDEGLVNRLAEGYVDFMELWPPAAPHARSPAYEEFLREHGVRPAHRTPEYYDAGVEAMELPALAWAIAYGFRPRLVHVRLSAWTASEARFGTVQRARELLFPFVDKVLKHQEAQGFLACVESDEPVWLFPLGLQPKWQWKQVKTGCPACEEVLRKKGRGWIFSNFPVADLVYPCPHGALKEAAGRAPPMRSLDAQWVQQMSAALSGVRRRSRSKGGAVKSSPLTEVAMPLLFDENAKRIQMPQNRSQRVYRVMDDGSAREPAPDPESLPLMANCPTPRAMRTMFMRLEQIVRAKKVHGTKTRTT